MNIQQLATQCQGYLQRKNRDNGEVFVCQTDNAPEWFNNMVYECHDGLLPNHWSYFAIESAIDNLAEGCEYPEPDTTSCRQWFNEYPHSDYFVDEVLGYGVKSICDALMQAMASHYGEVFYQVQSALEEQLEEMELGDG